MAKDLLDLHGFRGEDVLEALDRFLTRANEAGLSQVQVMTGKGTGVVKKHVAQYLKQAHYTWFHPKLSNGKVNEGVMVVGLE